MNKLSFLDELLEICSFAPLLKMGAGEIAAEIPAGMMDDEASPPQQVLVPTEAETRLPDVLENQSVIVPGALGEVTEPEVAIDEKRFNRVYGAGAY